MGMVYFRHRVGFHAEEVCPWGADMSLPALQIAAGADGAGRRSEKSMTRVHAHHILVSSKRECIEIRKKLEEGADFATVAMRYSECPSAKDGGDLGEVEQGKMGSELDKVLFGEEKLNIVKGPIKTKFGYHLVKVTSRTG